MSGPWRAVLASPAPVLKSGRGGLLGPDTDRRTRWWVLTLECGHTAERFVRYRKRTPEEKLRSGWGRARTASDVQAPPTRVRCDQCPNPPGVRKP